MGFRDPNGNEIAGWHIKTDPLFPFSLIAKLPSLPPSLPLEQSDHSLTTMQRRVRVRELDVLNSLSKGLEALKEHFRKSKFACDNDEYMPVVFSPPRDGRQLSEPIPV
ncbi:hypothetical protein BHM03_00060511, partial [Ensete ventricosum]